MRRSMHVSIDAYDELAKVDASGIDKRDIDAPMGGKFRQEFMRATIDRIRCHHMITRTQDTHECRGNGRHARIEQ